MARKAPIAAAALFMIVLIGAAVGSMREAHRVDELSVPAAKRVEVHGHRGARGLAPENTLPGFEKALDLGVDALEGDLRLTADAVVVIAHDAFVHRATCRFDAQAAGPPAPDPDWMPEGAPSLRIEALTFAQLARYRCDRNPDARRFPAQRCVASVVAGADYRIPSLEALFAFVEAYTDDPRKPLTLRANARQVRFNLETKPGPGTRGPLERAVIAAIARHGFERRVLLQSFDERSLATLHRLAPSISLAYLTRSPFADPEDVAELGVDYWSPDFRFLTEADVHEAHALGLRILPYTVDELDDVREILGLGVDGIISDRPDRVLELVGRSPRR